MSKYDDLVRKLKEIFQIDRPDLDFGIYRILNARAGEINAYLDNRLKSRVQEALAHSGNANQEQLRKELAEAEKNAEALGMKTDDVPKVRELRQLLGELAGGAADHENAVFSHLLTFFSRYYDSGDFISQRRYKGDTYAIPYAGEEVVLHWANKDQYYTKSGENFANYSFKLDDGRPVHFRLVAADTAKDNRKDNDKERRFVLIEQQTRIVVDDDGDEYEEELLPIEEVNGELLLRFAYRPMPKGSKQDDLVGKAVQIVLANEAVKSRWLDLARRDPTEKNPQRTLLEKHLTTYTQKNSADYFIHKDLGRFLRGELDFYIKNEVMNLDDVQNAERFADIEKNLRMIQCLRAIALDLITFLAQLEDFQKKLWLKKKFVVAAHYCITLDRIIKDAPQLLEVIAANEKQWEQWDKLGMLKKQIPPNPPSKKGRVNLDLPLASSPLSGDVTNKESPPLQKGDLGGFAAAGTVDYLREHPFLMADTALFDSGFKDKLLAAIDNLDESIDGLLIHGDNFQALNLLQERYQEQVNCIYIDPPYNTSASEIMYKNSYKHSSWLSLMNDRLSLGRCLLENMGNICATIDDVEFDVLHQLMEQTFGTENMEGIVPIRINPSGRPTERGFALTHEYGLFFGKSEKSSIHKIPRTEEQMRRFNENDKDGRFEWRNLRREGSNSDRVDGERQYYPIFADLEAGTVRIPKMEWIEQNRAWRLLEEPENDETIIYPVNDDGIEKNWRWSEESLRKDYSQFLSRTPRGGRPQVYYKYRASTEGTTPLTLWTDAKFSATEHGTKVLKDLFNISPFSYPKSIYAVDECLHVMGINAKKSSIVLDFFTGSGTTGHSVISYNRNGSKHKYILVEQGEYFDTVLKPRIQKVVYSADWKDGIATAPQTGISHAFKVLKIESYEDTLNNLELRRSDAQQNLLDSLPDGVQDDYLLRYMLDIESQGSILSVDSFRKPFDCTLKVAVDSAGAFEERTIDLVETFNYLIGLRVKSIDSLRERGIVMVQGTLPTGEKTLVLWRDCEQVDYEVLGRFCDSHAINPRDSEFDVFYINGDHNIPALLTTTEDEGGITRKLTLRQIEPEFLSRMFEEDL